MTGGELNLPGLDTQLGLSFTSTRPDNICIISSGWLDKAKPRGGRRGIRWGWRCSMCIHSESRPRRARGIARSISRSHPPPAGTCRKGVLRTGAVRIFFGTLQVTIVCCLKSMKLGRPSQYQLKKHKQTNICGPWANCLDHEITELFYSGKNWFSLVSAPWELFDLGPRTRGAHGHLGILLSSSCASSISVTGCKAPKCILVARKTGTVAYTSLIVPFTGY